jgi:hypothetical protein
MSRFRILWLFLVILSLSLGACSKKKDKEDKGPKKISSVEPLPASGELPADVMGYLVFASPANTFASLEKLAGMVGPVPPGALTGMTIQGLLKLGLKDTSVIDLKNPAGLVILNPKKHKVPVVIAVSVTGKDKLLGAIKPTWKKKAEKDGVYEMVSEQLDTYAVFEGGAKAPPKTSKSMFISFSGKTLFAAVQPEALKAGTPLLGKYLKNQSADVSGLVRVDHLRKVFAAEMAGMPDMIKQEMKRDPSIARMQDPQKMSWLMDWMVDKMFAFVEQTKQVAFSTTFTETEANFQFGMGPEDGSFFKKLLSAQKHAPLKLDKGMPTDHFLVMAFNAQWDLLKKDMLDFTKEIMKIFFEQELSEELIAIFTGLWDVIGDEIAFSENLSADGLSIVEIFEVKDEAKAREFFDKAFKVTADLLKGADDAFMGMKMGFEGPTDLGKHDGVDVQQFTMTIDTAAMDEFQAKAIKAMYGDKLQMVMAIFDKQVALAMGKNSHQDVKDVIDRVRGKGKGFIDSDIYKNAAGPLGKKSGGYMFMSFSSLMMAGIKSTYAAMGKDAPDLKLPPSTSGIFWSFKSSPERLLMTVRLPADHLKEMGAAIQKMTSLNQ